MSRLHDSADGLGLMCKGPCPGDERILSHRSQYGVHVSIFPERGPRDRSRELPSICIVGYFGRLGLAWQLIPVRIQSGHGQTHYDGRVAHALDHGDVSLRFQSRSVCRIDTSRGEGYGPVRHKRQRPDRALPSNAAQFLCSSVVTQPGRALKWRLTPVNGWMHACILRRAEKERKKQPPRLTEIGRWSFQAPPAVGSLGCELVVGSAASQALACCVRMAMAGPCGESDRPSYPGQH